MSYDPQETPEAWLDITAFTYSITSEKEKTTMKFDFCIGIRPIKGRKLIYGRPNPIYNVFMDEAYKVANCVDLITPARYI